MRHRFLFSSLVAVVVLGSAIALAQSPVGALAGVAKPGDVAVVRNLDSGFKRKIKVGKSGRYQLRNLPNGSFQVTIRHPDGSTDAPKKVDVHIGLTTRVE